MGISHKTNASIGPRKRLILCRQNSIFSSSGEISSIGSSAFAFFALPSILPPDPIFLPSCNLAGQALRVFH
jgi:hypothetical protein